MKKILVAASMLFAVVMFAQPTYAHATAFSKFSVEKRIPASQVPAAVKNSFRSLFPGATNVQWERENEHGSTIYKAKFTLNGVRQSASFLPDGTFIG